jgi:hypothetical protein
MLVAFPLALAVLAWSPTGLVGWGLLWSLFVWCGGTALLGQLARDRGRRKEPELFRIWGGKPTTRLLRHRDTPNAVVLDRRHKKLQRLVTGVQIPTRNEEQANPDFADDVYDACTGFLLEKTRTDKEHFPLVFEENCNYGFRRNLWGMKPLGIASSLAGLGAIAVLFVIRHGAGIAPSPIALVCAAMTLSLLVGWVAWFTPDWVRIPAEAFAERLLAASENL